MGDGCPSGRNGYRPVEAGREREVPTTHHHHQQPDSLQKAAGMAGPMPLPLLLVLMVGLVKGDTITGLDGVGEGDKAGGWVKGHQQEFTGTTITATRTSTGKKLLTSSQDSGKAAHDPEVDRGSVSGREEKEEKPLLTKTTTPMSASEMRTRHEMAICQACLNGDSTQEMCKSCKWRSGEYVMESTNEQIKVATTLRTTPVTPPMVVPTIEVVDMKKGGADIDKGVDVDKGVEQPIDKINISAFVSDFNADSSSEVLKTQSLQFL